jgi:hypothetical protein
MNDRHWYHIVDLHTSNLITRSLEFGVLVTVPSLVHSDHWYTVCGHWWSGGNEGSQDMTFEFKVVEVSVVLEQMKVKDPR